MCYSVLIKTSLKELSFEFRTTLDLDSFRSLYELRLERPELKVPRGLDRYFLQSSFAGLIQQFDREEKGRLRNKIQEMESEISELKSKPTAANRKKIETREKKILSIQEKIALDLEAETPLDNRIFPFTYAPVVIEEGGKRKLIPMRYRLRTPEGGDLPSKYNVFNARHDSLTSAQSWRPIFGKNHAIFPFFRFYEWVERDGRKQEIFFSPEGRQMMWAASLYQLTPSAHPLYSFAMITDDPPPEVAAAGHDRCPIFLQQEKIDRWLAPGNVSQAELLQLLKNKEKTFYINGLVA